MGRALCGRTSCLSPNGKNTAYAPIDEIVIVAQLRKPESEGRASDTTAADQDFQACHSVSIGNDGWTVGTMAGSGLKGP